jgi:dTMP kinase
MQGQFITFEGMDGAGKSTHIHWLKAWLTARHIPHVFTREPGGTPLGEKLRTLLLTESMDKETETLLMFAARKAHLEEVILPHLKQGVWVISDRFTDATYAYQGGGRAVAWERIATLETWVQGELQPDLTVLFDISAKVSAIRLATARQPDRFEQEKTAFFQRVRAGYAKRMAQAPQRIIPIDASGDIDKIQQQLHVLFTDHLAKVGRT